MALPKTFKHEIKANGSQSTYKPQIKIISWVKNEKIKIKIKKKKKKKERRKTITFQWTYPP